MKGCKKLLALAFALSMLIGAILLFSFTASAETSGYFTYTVSNGEATITYCSTSISGNVTIPSTLGGYPVTSIGDDAFSRCSGLTSVTIGNSVTSIGDYAFERCTGLTSVTIGSGVTSIGDSAFYNCSGLTSVTIGNGVTSIGRCAFANTAYYNNSANWSDDILYIGKHLIDAKTSLSGAYSIREGTKTVADSAFSGCSGLTSVTIGNSVTSIGTYAFDGCSGLTAVNISDLASWCAIDFSGSYANPLRYAHNLYLNGTLVTSMVIPGGVTSIGNFAFYNCNGLTSVTIPDSVTSIGNYAFAYCKNLTSVTIPDSVTSIGYEAFRGCSGLTEMTLPFVGGSVSKNTYLGYIFGADSYTDNSSYVPKSLKKIALSDACTSVGKHAFYNCTGLTSVMIPDSVTSIGGSAFRGCSGLTSISLPFVGDKPHAAGDTYQYPFGYIFGSSSYPGGEATTQYYYGNSTSSTTSSTYYIPSSLKNVAITGSSNIPCGAFYNCCELTSITIPDSVTSIGEYAFRGCSGLTSVTIPDSVTSIGSSAFFGCSGLTSISLPFVGDRPHIATDTYQYPFGYIFGTSSYTGGEATTQYYYGNSTSSTTSKTYYIPSALKSVIITGSSVIPYGAFYNCSGLTSVSIGNGVTSIGNSAFSNCTGLTSVSIGNGVTSIGNSAFYNCTGLTSVTIPDSVTCIDFYAFQRTGLTSVSIGSGVTSISYTAFDGTPCSNDAENWDGDVLYIDNCLIKANSSISGEYAIKSGTRLLAQLAFRYCSGLTSVTIPDSVTSIGEGAFCGCSGLTEMTLPFVGGSASQNTYFGYIFGADSYTDNSSYVPKSLKKIALSDACTSVGEHAFYNCTGLTSVTIGGGVTSIGERAFYGPSGLYCRFLGDAPTFGTRAFSSDVILAHYFSKNGWTHPTYQGYLCKCIDLPSSYNPGQLDENNRNFQGVLFTLGEGTATVGDNSNNDDNAGFTGYAKLVIPETVTDKNGKTYTVIGIGKNAFKNNRFIETVMLPQTLRSIGEDAFFGCYYLEAFAVDPANQMFSSDAAGVLYNKSQTQLLYYPCASGTEAYTVAPTVNNIKAGSFHGVRYLKELTLPFVGLTNTATASSANTLFGSIFGTTSYTGGVSTKQYFAASSYMTYYVPSCLQKVTVTGGTIYYGAFYGCSNLREIVLEHAIKTVGEEAFYYCTALEKLVISENVTSMPGGVLRGCGKLKSLTLPVTGTNGNANGVLGYVFGTSSYTGGVSTWQQYSSSSAGTYYIPSTLETVVINKGNLHYGEFSGCSNIKTITLPAGSAINKYSFYKCSSLETVIIPDGVADIPDYAFYNCSSLTGVSLSDKCTYIGTYGFYGCSKLGELTIPAGCNSIGSYAFYQCGALKRVNIPSGVTYVRSYTFYGCSALAEITIPESVTEIGERAFSICSELTEIAIPDSTKTIGSMAFYDCAKLADISIGRNVSSIGDSAFARCPLLKSITFNAISCRSLSTTNTLFGSSGSASEEGLHAFIGESVTTIPSALFMGSKLTSIEFAAGIDLSSIGDSAFNNANLLTVIALPKGVGTIGSKAFYNCSSLAEISIPETVTRIGSGAFQNCAALKDINVSDAVTSLGSEAFKGCSAVETIYIGKNIYSLSAFDLPSYKKLSAIRVSKENDSYTSDSSGVLYNKGETTLICYPQARTWPYYNVSENTKTISSSAFINNINLINVLVPKTVTSITSGNFSGCSNILLLVYNDSTALKYAINNGISYEIADYKTLLGISIQSLPLNTTYPQGGEFDFEGLYVVAHYDIGDLQLNDYTLTYDNSTIGKQTVTVSYQNYTATFEITVVAPSISGIRVTPPSQTEYIEALPLNLSDMQVFAIWDNGNETVIPLDKVTVIGNTDSVGSHRILVVYKDAADREFSDSFRITVLAKSPISLEIKKLPDKTVYELWEELDLTGMVVYVCYDNGTAGNTTDYTVSGYYSYELGEQTLTVSFKNVSSTFTVTVEKKTNNNDPIDPILADVTATSVTLEDVYGYEYSKDGVNWQASSTFEQLEPHKEYRFYQRIKETDTYKPSKASNALTVVTKYALTGYISVSGRLLDGQVLTAESDYIAPSGATVSYQWYRNGSIITGALDATYTVTASDLTAILSVKATGVDDCYGTVIGYAPPMLPSMKNKTADSVTLVSVEGLEYSCGGEAWQASNVFDNLAPNTTYTFYQRVAASDSCPASERSEALTVTTDKCTIAGTVSVSGSTSVGNTLTADITGVLPNDAELAYQWYREDVPIDGATGTTYTTGTEDGNKKVYVEVTGINAYTGTLMSDPVRITVPVSGVSIEEPAITVKTGETIILTCTVAPATATNKDVVWSTSGEGFVSVEEGVVTGLKKGTETVTVTTVDGGFTATCVVTVECAHSASHSVPAEASTCYSHGHEAYTVCDECGEIIEGSDAELPFAEHQNLETRNAKEATCYETGYTGDVYCNDCNTLISSGTVIEMLDHTPGEAVEENRIEPTCTEDGGYDAVSYCTICGAELSREHAGIAALGHDLEIDAGKPATCTETGLSEGKHCTRCDYKVEQTVIPALGHDLVTDPAVAATCTATGLTEGKHCTRCDYKIAQEVVPMAAHSYKDGKCTVCGAKDPDYKPPVTTNPFNDVKEGEFYYEAVLWAVNADPQVTSGTSATTFSPNATCTRAQVVTFLWRAKGCPEPKTNNNPFNDVKAGDYYYKAVLWAVENGITAGTSATTFSPNAGCTRAQVVTFLWRTEGQPKPTSSANPFTDVKGGYYYDAVLWAVEKGITAGTSATTFSPDATCTRGQIVTFLYRAFAA